MDAAVEQLADVVAGRRTGVSYVQHLSDLRQGRRDGAHSWSHTASQAVASAWEAAAPRRPTSIASGRMRSVRR